MFISDEGRGKLTSTHTLPPPTRFSIQLFSVFLTPPPWLSETAWLTRNCDNCPKQVQLNKVSCDSFKVHLFTILMVLWVCEENSGKMSQACKNSLDSSPLTKQIKTLTWKAGCLPLRFTPFNHFTESLSFSP